MENNNRMAGGGDELKLLGAFGSAFVLRVKLALSFKGLDFEDVDEDLANKSELLLSSNPARKQVPVLIHNGKPVCDSQVIVQYIDEVFCGTGPSLLPADPCERAVARGAAFIDDKLLSSWLVHAGPALYGMQLFDDAKSPLLAAWMERFGALDAVKAVLPDVDRLVEFAKMKQAH